MANNYYIPGANNVICDRTGFKIKSFQSRKQWDNQIVRSQSYESRHPQDLIESKQDSPGIQDSRPRAEDRFLSTNEVTKESL